jgi:methylenetetrahydrofolate--tRNA-(uracil-5-)-methyltransferase
MEKVVHIIGGGLAGSECAYQLAQKGIEVHLHEMRRNPKVSTPAHKTQKFAELVCSNSFGSQTDYSAPGQLKWEAQALDSLILKLGKKAAVPAGMALGVDRELFSELVSKELKNLGNIMFHDDPVENWSKLSGIKIIATGPLTHPALAQNLSEHFGSDFLYFYDAIAPIIDTDSIDMKICYKADRYGKGNGDYINCPFTKDEYEAFVTAIEDAEKVEFKNFEKTNYFDGCMPVEAIVERGRETLRHGPLSPKGLRNPHFDEDDPRHRPYAVLQLRQDNINATAYNLVGCQTKMTYPEQKRVFRMVPGLKNADFLKLGSIHRNMFINSPLVLNKDLSSKKDSNLFFAGQLTGVEGYFESTCTGLMVSHFVIQKLNGEKFNPPPRASAFGSILNFLNEPKNDFQPMNCNFSLFPPIEVKRPKEIRKKSDFKRYKRDQILARAKDEIRFWLQESEANLKSLQSVSI